MEIKELIEHAIKEQWEIVEKEIPKVASDYRYLDWAKKLGIQDEDYRVRDLAASIFEHAQLREEDLNEVEIQLFARLQAETSPAVRCRAAFALASQNFQKNQTEIKEVLNEATKEPHFKDRAEGYLETFNE
ncbi:MAG: hypothetical protein ABEI74_01495 [Candidatus Pacearchaeota archaeon]